MQRSYCRTDSFLRGAGADTTSIGMRSCLYCLAKNPQCYRQLQKEVDDFYKLHNLDKPLTYLESQILPYLQAVVSETTRLLPPIVFQLPRYAPADLSSPRSRRIQYGRRIFSERRHHSSIHLTVTASRSLPCFQDFHR